MKTHVTLWHFLFLLIKSRLKIEIEIVLSWFDVYTVILCKYQVLLVFVSESFYNHQLNLQKVANVMPWQAWNGWSAKSLVVHDNPHLRSLIYIKKKKGPRADPWWTPAKTSAQDEDWPFKTTLWYLLLKKFSASFNGVSDIPNDLILYTKPSCQTLSRL